MLYRLQPLHVSENRHIEKKLTRAGRYSSPTVRSSNAHNITHLKAQNGRINTDNIFGKLNDMQEI